MLSPTLVVRDYQIEDLYPYSVVLPTPRRDFILFPKGNPFPHDKEMTLSGTTTFDFQVSYINDMDFPAGVSLIVGRFMIGHDEPSDAENVTVKVKLNDHGIFEVVSAMEDMSSYSYFGSYVLNLPFSENLHVSTTKDELREAIEREKMLAEQDMKVEQNNLESFVYDIRSKLSSAYRNIATDSEKERLSKSLQETEDWLHEDSDYDYTGKFEDLKKLLQPIENRYKEENARAKAVKDLQTCIAKHRSHADSLPARQKEEVKGLCNRAERRLNDISQKPSSYINEAIDVFESGCRNMMRPKPSQAGHELVNKKDQRNTLELFVYDTRSKLLSEYQSVATDAENELITNLLLVTEDWLNKESDYIGKLQYLKKFLEPIENRYKEENARAKAVKDLQTCIAKYRSHADSLPARQKVKVKNECNKVETWLNNNTVQQHSSLKNSSSYIDQVIVEFESICTYKMRPFSKYDDPVVSDQMDQPVMSGQMEEPEDLKEIDQLVDSKKDQPVDSNKRGQSVDSNRRDQDEKSNRREQPMKSIKGDQPMNSNRRDQPVGLNKTDQPTNLDKR